MSEGLKGVGGGAIAAASAEQLPAGCEALLTLPAAGFPGALLPLAVSPLAVLSDGGRHDHVPSNKLGQTTLSCSLIGSLRCSSRRRAKYSCASVGLCQAARDTKSRSPLKLMSGGGDREVSLQVEAEDLPAGNKTTGQILCSQEISSEPCSAAWAC